MTGHCAGQIRIPCKSIARPMSTGTTPQQLIATGAFRRATRPLPARWLWQVIIVLAVLGGCGGADPGSAGFGTGKALINGNFAIAYVKRPLAALGDPTDGITFAPGGDLYLRDLSSPSAAEINITGDYTQGRGDVSDPEVSFDATELVFAMRGPDDPTWNIWRYHLETGRLERVIDDPAIANAGDDVDPAFLPDGRIVFSSNRQQSSFVQLSRSGDEPYRYLDEYERQTAIVLHVMDATGDNIRQISFNQSHDRNPSVLASGEIVFSRWDHLGPRNQFSIFVTNPDGTGLFILYGAHSPGNSFLHPREMPDGRLVSTLMPLSGTREGGALVAIDVRNFSENDMPAPGATPDGPGQRQITFEEIPLDGSFSPFGRYTTPYPLYDGTNRMLVSWTPSRPVTVNDPLTGEPQVVEDEPVYGVYMLDLSDRTMRPIVLAPEGFAVLDAVPIIARPRPNAIADKPLDAERAAAGTGILNVKSVYDTDQLERMGPAVIAPGELLPLIPAPANDSRTQVADIARIKNPLLTPADRRPARFVRVTRAVPTPPGLSREVIGETPFEMQQLLGYAEIEPDGSFRIAVPADQSLALTVVDREGRGFTPHTSWLQVRPGETRTCNGCHSPRRGSALNVSPIAGNHPLLFGRPANDHEIHVHPGLSASSRLSAADPDGDNLTFFIVQPPRQGTVVITDTSTGDFTYTANSDALLGPDIFTFKVNDGTTDSNEATFTVFIHAKPLADTGETMAEMRVRTFPEIAELQSDLLYTDVWGDRLNPCIRVRYVNNTDCFGKPLPAEDLSTPVPQNGLINYPEHIQPLWEKDRGPDTCTGCHNNDQTNDPRSAGLDLRATITGSGRQMSYQALLVGRIALDVNGLPRLRQTTDGTLRVEREPALVVPGAARASYLIEKLFEQELNAARALTTTVDHRRMLNRAERRLVAEWIDLGAQYYNWPFGEDRNGNGRRDLQELRNTVTGLDRTVFAERVHPILMARCAGCHRPVGRTGDPPPGERFVANRFILTGQVDGDFNAARHMVNQLQDPAASYLLSRPASSGIPPAPVHPRITPDPAAPDQQFPVLSPSEPADPAVVDDYNTLFAWIDAARVANGL